MTQIDKDLFDDTQKLIEIWDTLTEAMATQKVDIAELSCLTLIPERELEDYLENYADVKLRTLFKIARTLKCSITIGIS